MKEGATIQRARAARRPKVAEPERIDVSGPDALQHAFSVASITYTIKRIASKRDKDDLIAHPLRAGILIELETELSEMISRLVSDGFWGPAPAYLCLTLKRSGSYRELVFPGLVDSIVGRRAIDALEQLIVRDDNERAYCGRSHASSNREPGDYESWFKTWQDFSSAIAKAAKNEDLAYIFDTDVADFFPSIDRSRARQFLSQRTGAHPTLVELIFYCLEAWLPRFDYMPGAGLPIEPNDVSRLVAHNYLKLVDEQFPDKDGQRYRRYVDDTTIFVRTREDAEAVKRQHHLALRMVGLNPNAAKSEILSVDEYEARRHRDINRELSRIGKHADEVAFRKLARDWYSDRDRKSWSQVAKRLYRIAAKHQWPAMTRHVEQDLRCAPVLAEAVADYLIHLPDCSELLDILTKAWIVAGITPEQRIHIGRVLCDGSFGSASSGCIAKFALDQSRHSGGRQGTGYARGLLLLALNKHGKRADRKKLAEWASAARLTDPQLRLHFLYVFVCRQELGSELRSTLQQVMSSDTELLLQLSDRALVGGITEARRILRRYVRVFGDTRSVEARVLPLISALVTGKNPSVGEWLVEILKEPSKTTRGLRDQVTRRLLQQLHDQLVS